MKKNKILLSVILPFLVFMTNVCAYDFSGITKIPRVDFRLYNDSLQVGPTVSCTSSNDGFCGLEDSDLPNSSNTYNIIQFVLRGNLNKTFELGTQYKISWYFYQYTSGYFIRGADITQVVGKSYQNLTNWTSDSITILTYNLSLIESESNVGLYRMDVTFIPTNTTIAGFNFNLYSDYNTISNNNDCYLEGTRYMQIVQISSTSPDYTQDLNNINQNISDSTQDVIDNQNQNTQDIIDNQNQNTQDIIDNQNQNTQDIIDSNRVCTTTKFDKTDGHFDAYLDNGNLISSQNYVVTNYIEINSSTVLKVLQPRESGSAYVCFYDSSKVKISCANAGNRIPGSTITIPTGSAYVMMTIHKSTNLPTYEIYTCKNGNQAVSDTLTDSTPPDTDSLSNASGWLPPGPVDSILNLPLTLLQSLNNAFSSNSCQPISIDLPHISNRPLVIPCMSTVWQGFGLSSFFTWIGRVLGGVLLYKYLIGLYKWVDDTLTMRENNNFDDGSLG